MVFQNLFLGLILSALALWPGPASGANALSPLQTALQNQLNSLQAQISAYRDQIQQLKNQQQTLEQEIKLANLDILKIEKQIEAAELALRISDERVASLEREINKADQELGRQRNILGHFLVLLHSQDSESLAEAVLAENNFHDFFSKYQALTSLQGRLLESVGAAQDFKAGLEDQRAAADQERDAALELRSLQQYQRAALQSKIAVKQNLIAQSQAQAEALNAGTQDAQEAVAQIRRHLYVLRGLNDSLTLEMAYGMAARVAGRLNIRPALLMALIKKESDWGSRVGSGTWRRDMHPRDHAAFLSITKKLGLNPDVMPVSRKPDYGWGGAMGPAQFLPNTWLIYEDEIAVVTGHNPPSPWDLEDAFAAAAIKLARNGANERTWPAEWKAAQIYFAGGNWQLPQYSFYGDAVMELADEIEQQLKSL